MDSTSLFKPKFFNPVVIINTTSELEVSPPSTPRYLEILSLIQRPITPRNNSPLSKEVVVLDSEESKLSDIHFSIREKEASAFKKLKK
jgi:hypothetical protein